MPLAGAFPVRCTCQDGIDNMQESGGTSKPGLRTGQLVPQEKFAAGTVDGRWRIVLIAERR